MAARRLTVPDHFDDDDVASSIVSGKETAID